jgi:hypothetical protein
MDATRSGDPGSRNPFGAMDVPEPDDRDVTDLAAATILDGGAEDVNAAPWPSTARADAIDGVWSSRWNGGADPTIPGDAPDRWKQGVGEVKTAGEQVYLRFDWDGGRRRGLIDARRDGEDRLVGTYINLTDPEIVQPWVGRIVDATRIDGRWARGRLDFRR